MSGRLVVLDAAGTLIEVRGSVGAVYAALARAAGADLDAAAVEKGFVRAFRTAPPLAFGGLDEAARPAAERGWWREVARRALEPAGPLPTGFVFEVFFERAWSWFAEPEAWHVPADVRPGLRALRRAGCPLAVFSNWDGRLEPLLDRLGLMGYFAGVLVSGGLPAAKPDPAAFRAARAALKWAGNAPPIMVGDRIDHDIVPALEAGWDAVWLDRGRRGERPPVGAARVIDLTEVERL